jgi:hypothetical protein
MIAWSYELQTSAKSSLRTVTNTSRTKGRGRIPTSIRMLREIFSALAAIAELVKPPSNLLRVIVHFFVQTIEL